MSTEGGHQHGRRVFLDLGLGVASILALVGLMALEAQVGPSLPRASRGLARLLAGLVAFAFAGRVLYDREESWGPLPLARLAAAAVATLALGAAAMDIVTVHCLPRWWFPLLAGGVALAAAVAGESVLLAMIGAELIDRELANQSASWFGMIGGFGSTAVVFQGLVALVEIPLGWKLAKGYRRTLGLGILCNGGLSLTYTLLTLGSFGPNLHGRPEWTWLSPLYFAIALVVSVLFVRMVARLDQGGVNEVASRVVIVTITYIMVWLGCEQQLAFLVGMMAYWAMQAGGLFEVAPEMAGGSVEGEGDLDGAEVLAMIFRRMGQQDPAAMRWAPARQAAYVRNAALGLLVAFGGAHLLGTVNVMLPSKVAFEMKVDSGSIEPWLEARFGAVFAEDDFAGGEALDLYLVPSKVQDGKLVFTELHAVRRGAEAPEEVDAESCWVVPGRAYAMRDVQGRYQRGLMIEARTRFEVPPRWAREVEWKDTLVFRGGALGFTHPSHVVRDPDADMAERGGEGSWLFAAE